MSSGVWFIVGLGNPGKKYLCHRHNIGFMVIDNFLVSVGKPPIKEEHGAFSSRFQMDSEAIMLACPQTYMNRSGEVVKGLISYYKLDVNQMLVIHDEIDLPFGVMKFQRDRGHGGHNGIRNIHEQLGRQDYARLRMGVGRPADPRMEVANYVLQDFSPEESSKLTLFLNRASDAVESFVFNGFDRAANEFNGMEPV